MIELWDGGNHSSFTSCMTACVNQVTNVLPYWNPYATHRKQRNVRFSSKYAKVTVLYHCTVYSEGTGKGVLGNWAGFQYALALCLALPTCESTCGHIRGLGMSKKCIVQSLLLTSFPSSPPCTTIISVRLKNDLRGRAWE